MCSTHTYANNPMTTGNGRRMSWRTFLDDLEIFAFSDFELILRANRRTALRIPLASTKIRLHAVGV
eukprot:CAMPEP_0173112470 /NCGR_PEP_ID=MMETSP1102-20130122/46060_1 /TAXON_ID=49646 /ORGANISM="Geminigera sp., Strain Caron Lab Isolate" /LENGTH=65 /DNA_ID=CAMNT_0014013593 /DNA_START=41 /DNA_END=238 /DNA_ORIENTATION=+